MSGGAWRRRGKRGFAILVALALVGLSADRLWRYQDNHLVFGSNSGFLGDYRLAGEPRALGGGVTQASGLSFDEDSGRLYLIANAPPQILELDADGEILRRIELRGFEDTEGIASLGGDQFALVSEARRRLYWFRLEPGVSLVDEKDAAWFALPPSPKLNRGPEGISFDAEGGQLYLVYEMHPRKLYRIDWRPTVTGLAVDEPWDAEAQPWFGLRSLSGVQYHPGTGHLFILSRKSRSVVEFTLDGREVGRLYLKAGSAGLQERIRSPEGIAITPDGRLFICSEPDLLYQFLPPAASGG